MDTYPHLSHAPIKEAVIGFNIQPSHKPVLLAELRSGFERVDGYSQPVDVFFNEARLEMAPQLSSRVNRRHIGFRSDRQDGLFVFQARTDGFFFSRMFPYSDWEDLLNEYQKIYGKFQAFYAGATVSGVFVRTINELPIPFRAPIEDYLSFYTRLPTTLPQAIRNFFLRYELSEGNDVTAAIQLARLPDIAEGEAQKESRVLLDIDVRANHEGILPEQALKLIDTLHEPKNRIFFSCITEKMVHRFK